jgi:hypothetical protein
MSEYENKLDRRDPDTDWQDLSLDEKVDRNRSLIIRLQKSSRFKWKALAVWIVAFSAVAISLYIANHHRINDIQQSRIESCKKNYSSLPEFTRRVFFPREVKSWTPEQRTTSRRMDTTAEALARRCERQTAP